KVFDGKTGLVVESFYAYEPTFQGGVTVAVGQLNGRQVIVTGAGVGGGPLVKVFDGQTGQQLASFYAFDPKFAGGVNVAVGDVLADGKGAIVTAAGYGGGPQVKVFDASGALARSFYAYDPAFTGGVSVAVGDVVGLGHPQLITGAGPG